MCSPNLLWLAPSNNSTQHEYTVHAETGQLPSFHKGAFEVRGAQAQVATAMAENRPLATDKNDLVTFCYVG